MIFGSSATHALRALAYLAADEREEATLGRDLAEEVGVPAPYLAKVLATLARAGLLTASRGVRGGYRLARPPDEIMLREIVEPFEGKRLRPGCLLRPDRPCAEDGTCPAHSAWFEAKAVYTTFLETTRLADVRGGRRAPPDRRKVRPVRQRAARTRTGSSVPRRTRV